MNFYFYINCNGTVTSCKDFLCKELLQGTHNLGRKTHVQLNKYQQSINKAL